jgi:predicted ABC-type transport system involved in lysophospholipase L1 biosynthesis ATPase subunit
MDANARAAFRALNIGFVFQQFHLVPYLNVLDNVLTATLGTRRSEAHVARAQAFMLIERLGLTDRLRHRPAQLSTSTNHGCCWPMSPPATWTMKTRRSC